MTIEDLRQHRLGGYAIFDFVVSFVGVYLLAPWLSRLFLRFGLIVPKSSWMYLTLPASIVIHLLSGNMTLMTKNFLDPQGHYLLKIFVIGLLILGLRGISRN